MYARMYCTLVNMCVRICMYVCKYIGMYYVYTVCMYVLMVANVTHKLHSDTLIEPLRMYVRMYHPPINKECVCMYVCAEFTLLLQFVIFRLFGFSSK